MKSNAVITKKWVSAIFGATLLASVPSTLLADDDSSSDINGGFAHAVEHSEGVMIRVPVNASGLENTDAAEMRLNVNANVSDSTSLPAAFQSGIDASTQPQVSEADLGRDSSTGWRRWANYGWQYNYYHNYRPYYCYYGSYYPYSYAYSYNYYGYNYYYYNRYW